MKKILALCLVCGLLLGCANGFICTHKSQETTILNGIIIGATALAAILPATSPLVAVAIDIVNGAKSELAAKCPDINNVAELQKRLANTIQAAQAAGMKINR